MKQKIVITGASKGIGFELAQAFLDNNYKVVGTCRTGKVAFLAFCFLTLAQISFGQTPAVKKGVDDEVSI